MHFEPVVGRERFLAHGTRIGLLARVPGHVHLQSVALGEDLRAYLAREHFLANVTPHVHFQVRRPFEHRITNLTHAMTVQMILIN